VSFGRRLALYFVLIALLPTLALGVILVFVSDDSRRGKADARLAADLETAMALYEERIEQARPEAERLGREPALSAALESDREDQVEAFADESLDPPVLAVEVLDADGDRLAAAGSDDAIAFARVTLNRDGAREGVLGASVSGADSYVNEVQNLTGVGAIVSRNGEDVAATVTPPDDRPEAGQTADLEAEGEKARARSVALNAEGDEVLTLIGPRAVGGRLAIGALEAAILLALLGGGMALAYRLARTLSRRHAEVAEEAATDPLTGLFNRRSLAVVLDQEVLRAVRFGHPLSLLIVDVDDFKRINDERGHPQGDAVLRCLADLVRKATRAIDRAARYGGDELALTLIETDAEGARTLADRLRDDAAKQELSAPDGPLRFTISIGVATLPDAAADLDGLVEAADQALLEAKRTGKNRIVPAPRRRGRSPQAAP
jgi:diguanylate cyclase (GGDEF)-like protein